MPVDMSESSRLGAGDPEKGLAPDLAIVLGDHFESGRGKLGLRDATQLPIRGNLVLLELGLGPVAAGSKIPRAMWDSREAGPSTFQKTAVAIGLGAGVTPK